jgi:hypothetical protein
MAYSSRTEKEIEIENYRAKLDEALQPHGRWAPRPFIEENLENYQKRTFPTLREVSKLPDVKADDARGAAFNLILDQTFKAAHSEVHNPTVPEGQLKEVIHKDVAGHKISEFFGSPKVWLSQFAAPSKRLVGIRTQTERGYNPGNLG